MKSKKEHKDALLQEDEYFPPLARTDRERIITNFEQSLICAAQAFYRFAGVVLGSPGQKYKLTGHENVIFQQILFTPQPRSLTELSRFSNRDDISNIQYSLRKLIAANLIEKVPGSTNRDTRYRPTAEGYKLTEEVIASRRELLVEPSLGIPEIEAQLKAATDAMSLLTGLYDHASRVMSGRL